jgi:hypothetical protein
MDTKTWREFVHDEFLADWDITNLELNFRNHCANMFSCVSQYRRES